MAKHIGIVAVSSEGAALCHRTICLEAPARMGAYQHPELSMHGHSLGDYITQLDRGDWEGVASLMLSSASRLAGAGAELLICPDNTVHQAWAHLVERTPLPWLHIAAAVAREARSQGYTRLAVLGTGILMDGPVYPEELTRENLECRMPDPAERKDVDRIIFEELLYARLEPTSRQRMVDIIARLAKQEQCDAVVLGCTEIPLLIAPEDSPLPVLDSTRLLARAALRESVGH
jgi:aspartate racemase